MSILSAIGTMFRFIAYSIVVLFVLLIGTCTFLSERQADHGRSWCDEVIRQFTANPEAFITENSAEQQSRIYVTATREDGIGYPEAMASFNASSPEDYRCVYSQGGIMFPHGHEYTSETKEWIYID